MAMKRKQSSQNLVDEKANINELLLVAIRADLKTINDHAVFKSISTELPLGIEGKPGGWQAPFDASAYETAITNESKYKAAINFFWLDP